MFWLAEVLDECWKYRGKECESFKYGAAVLGDTLCVELLEVYWSADYCSNSVGGLLNYCFRYDEALKFCIWNVKECWASIKTLLKCCRTVFLRD